MTDVNLALEADILPAGLHPQDRSTPAPFYPDPAAPPDAGGPRYDRSRKPWATENAQALAVFQRLGPDAACGIVFVTTADPVNRVVQRRPGRTQLTLWVPASYFAPNSAASTTTPSGVIVAEDQSKLWQGGSDSVPLFVGDSMDWPSESPVWVGLQPGQTTGVVAWMHAWDGPGRATGTGGAT